MEICFCPKFVLNRVPIPSNRIAHFNFLVSAGVILTATPLLSYVPHVCLAQWLLRIPCPGCGIIHSLSAIAGLDLHGAWTWNPAGIPLATFLLLQIVFRSIALIKPSIGQIVIHCSQMAGRLVLGCLTIVWLARLIHT